MASLVRLKVGRSPLLALLAAPIILSMSGCSDLWLPERIEEAVGRRTSERLLARMPIDVKEGAWQSRLETIGRQITPVCERPNYHYKFYLVDSHTVNAFAAPDGSIFVTNSLLKLVADDEIALAGVLSHEIGHVARRHGAEILQAEIGYRGLMLMLFGFERPFASQAVDMANRLVDLGYGRDMELEADLCSVRYLTRLGYPPNETLRFLRVILALDHEKHGPMEKYFANHPPTQERIAYAERYIRDYLEPKKASR